MPSPSRTTFLCSAAALLLCAASARAQIGTESSVGYVDSAIPTSQVRLRYDAASRDNAPDRAEFFYAKFNLPSGPSAPGPPRVEQSLDYQDVEFYLEYAFLPNFSAFAHAPLRWVNPTINDNNFGLGDSYAGFKWAFLTEDDTLATFQLRTAFPTGAASRGLGTHHVSLEPALLVWHRLAERLVLEGELRDWIPVGGTDFAGNVLRTGAGLSYRVYDSDFAYLSPVAELVGWAVLSGKQSTFPTGTPRDAAGDLIVNAKFGVRMGMYSDDLQAIDLYVGYGRALTGDVWYKDVVRVELRVRY